MVGGDFIYANKFAYGTFSVCKHRVAKLEDRRLKFSKSTEMSEGSLRIFCAIC